MRVQADVTKTGASGLVPGDVVVTKHSNLSEVTAVFHLVGERNAPLSEVRDKSVEYF